VGTSTITRLDLWVAAALATVSACTLNSTGLGFTNPGREVLGGPNADAGGYSGGGGTWIADEHMLSSAGSAGGGSAGAGGAGGGDVAGSGAAGDGLAGTGGVAGSLGGGQAGSDGQPDASGTAGESPDQPDAQPSSSLGCADGTREGFNSVAKYPNIAACAGAWQVPGFVAPETLTPQCDRHAGNDGNAPDGIGCSVADLCADGWHVCDSASEVSMNTESCSDATPPGAPPAFYATRQRGSMMTCDRTNQTGTSNIFGCGNIGSTAMSACAPLIDIAERHRLQRQPTLDVRRGTHRPEPQRAGQRDEARAGERRRAVLSLVAWYFLASLEGEILATTFHDHGSP